MSDKTEQLAQALFRTWQTGEALSDSDIPWEPSDFDEAYAVQDRIVELHEEDGARRVGMKAGVTNPAKLKELGGGSHPLSGVLFDRFNIPENDAFDASRLINPRIEAEIAFYITQDLAGPGCHAGQVLRATEFVVPALEIVDIRYATDGPGLTRIAADNVAASHFAIGSNAAGVSAHDLRTLGVVVERNGEAIGLGAGAAVWNHPVESVAALANALGARGRCIPAGSIVLSGSLIAPTPISRGDSITARFQHLGGITIQLA